MNSEETPIKYTLIEKPLSVTSRCFTSVLVDFDNYLSVAQHPSRAQTASFEEECSCLSTASLHSKKFTSPLYFLGRRLGESRKQSGRFGEENKFFPFRGPQSGCKDQNFSFNRTQSRVVFGLLIGHNTMRRYFHLMGLNNSAVCRRCGAV